MNIGPPGSGLPSRRLGIVLTLGWSLLILILTLRPDDPRPGAIGSLCLICGSRGSADAILNLGLFIPLGIGVGLLRGWRTAALVAFALSGCVELAQTVLPGRFPTLGDLIFNTAGGALGAAMIPALASLPALLASRPSRRRRLAGQGVSVLLLVLPLLLLLPRFPATTWFGQWTPELGHMELYGGRVLEASVGGIPVLPGRLDDAAPLRAALIEGRDVRVRFVGGAPPGRLAPIFAIYDDASRQILMVGVEGTAVVYHRRTFAAALALDQPGIVWHGALDRPPGDTVDLRIERRRSGVCLELDGEERCGKGFGVAAGWRILISPGPTVLSPVTLAFLGFLWTAVLAVPAGAMAASWKSAVGTGLVLGLLSTGTAWVVPALLAHPGALIGTTAGALAGRAIASRIASRAGRGPRGPGG